MEAVRYSVKRIDGDYAILVAADETENPVALALLPLEIEEGDTVIWENWTYRIEQ